jgi:hypothetical protein
MIIVLGCAVSTFCFSITKAQCLYIILFIAARIFFTYISDKYLVIYGCQEILKDGTCDDLGVMSSLFSRNLDPIPEEDIKMLITHGQDHCIEPGDYAPVSHQSKSTTSLCKACSPREGGNHRNYIPVRVPLVALLFGHYLC